MIIRFQQLYFTTIVTLIIRRNNETSTMTTFNKLTLELNSHGGPNNETALKSFNITALNKTFKIIFSFSCEIEHKAFIMTIMYFTNNEISTVH